MVMIIKLIVTLTLSIILILNLIFSILTLYAKNLKVFAYTLLFLIPTAYAIYLSIFWINTEQIVLITIYLIFAIALAIIKISEPDIGILDRFLSASLLEKRGKYYAAARKYERKGELEKAAECYESAGYLESAAYAYEEAGNFDKAAKCYEKLSKKETAYLSDASKMWEKAGNLRRAAELLEKYAMADEWYLEDAARLWEKVDTERAKKLWTKVAKYYEKEAKEEGVFYEDAAEAYRKSGNNKKAIDMYKKFIDYCKEQAKNDKSWEKYVKEAEEKTKTLSR